MSDRIEQLSAALSRARGARWLHPVGDVYDAVLDVPGGAGTGAALFDTPASHRAKVRLSRAVGLPKPLPEPYRLAFRLLDREIDLLLTTSIDAPILHHLPMPAPGGPRAQTSSSLLAYDVGGRTPLQGPRRPVSRGSRRGRSSVA